MKSLPHSPHCGQVVVVFGAAVWEYGRPSPALERRVRHAVSLIRSGRATYLLVTGGVGKHPPSEAQVMKQVALERGVPAHLIFTEETGASTFHSALACAKIMCRHNWTTAIVVTDVYHIPRTVLLFRCLGIAAVGHPPPGGRQANPPLRWFVYYLRECVAFPWYCILILHRLIYSRKLQGG